MATPTAFAPLFLQSRIVPLALLSCLLLPVQPAFSGENWTGFQNGGQLDSGKIASAADYTKAWEVDINGYGQSSPTVWGDLIYITSVTGEKKDLLHITAHHKSDGKPVWTYELTNATPQDNSSYVSRAAPSPVLDEQGLYVFFEGGNIAALDHEGNLRWQKNLVEEYGPITARHGLASSLEQDDKTVFAWVERMEDPYIVALNKTSGELLWKSAGLGVTSWSSPRMISVGETKHLVLSGVGKIAGLDPATGEQLWDFEEISGNTTPTPIPVGNDSFLVGASVGRGQGDSGNASKSNGVIKISSQQDGSWKAGFVWRSKRATCSFGSPLYANGYCYFVNKAGVLYCLDAADGNEVYANRIGGSIWATPVAADQQVLFPLKEGELVFANAGADFKITGKIETIEATEEPENEAEQGGRGGFSGPTLYAAIVIDGQILVRLGDKLISYQSGS